MFSRIFHAGLSACLIASLVASPIVAAPPLSIRPASPVIKPMQQFHKKIAPISKTPQPIVMPPTTKATPKVTPPTFVKPRVVTPLVTPKLKPTVTPPKLVTPKFNPPKFVLPANPPRFAPPAEEADQRRPMNGGWAGPLPWDWGQGDADVPADPEGDPVPEAAPPADPGVQDGPTPWDWVAIGLGAAALVRLNEGGGCSVGQPMICHDPVVVPQTVVVERVVTEPSSGVPAPGPSAEVPTVSSQESNLPRLESGKPFELPGNGLGASAGRVALKIGPVYAECRVDTWIDTGLKATVPPVVLAEAAPAELLVAGADGKPLVRLDVLVVPTR
jgi:hypothetical protein